VEILQEIQPLFVATIVAASLAGIGISSLFPWSNAAFSVRLPWYVGLGLAPFLFGFVNLALLGFYSGAPHQTHRLLLFVCLLTIGLALMRHTWLLWRNLGTYRLQWRQDAPALLLLLFGLGLLCNAFFLPLTQNDAQEYAMVGRILFETRDLASYPAIRPEQTASGFFAPWTHPPLYVAQIYGMNLLQGHADSPGLMRLISPWCALVATGIIVGLGSLLHRRAGWIAALLYLSTPLFFLGADSALIDALTILASVLILAGMVGFQGRLRNAATAHGILLGLALWTHSSAILLLPLSLGMIAVHYGLRHWRTALLHIAITTGIACLIAAWPYGRNLMLFGSLISDNPAVFALPSLRWDDYFAYNRGLNSPGALLQYGLFKGWFALESYGGVFWLMAVGGWLYLRRLSWASVRDRCWHGCADLPAETRIVWLCLTTIGIYHAGVIASIALGIDLMIRNERYMLLLLPYIVLVASWGIHSLIEAWKMHRRWRRYFAACVISCTLLAVTLQFFSFVLYRLHAYGLTSSGKALSHEDILRQTSEYDVMRYLRMHTPEDAFVLSLRPSNMYYGQRRMMSYLDERLLEFYGLKDISSAYAWLKKHGVTHVESPSYALPPYYNSVLMDVLSDPRYSTLTHQEEGYQLFTIGKTHERLGPAQEIVGQEGWQRFLHWIIGGRKPLKKLQASAESFDSRTMSSRALPFGLLQRDFSTLLLSPPIAVPKKTKEIRIDLRMQGEAAVRLMMIQYNAQNEPTAVCQWASQRCYEVRFGEISLGDATQTKRFSRRFVLAPDAVTYRLGIEHLGNSSLQLQSLTVRPVLP